MGAPPSLAATPPSVAVVEVMVVAVGLITVGADAVPDVPKVYTSAGEAAEAAPSAIVTIVSTAPPDDAGVVTTICVAESLTMVPGSPPKETETAFARFVPVIVTDVPPAVVPPVGLTLVTVGVPGAAAW